jgi:hypothetical protein
MLQDLNQCPNEESQQFSIESQKQIMARLKNPASLTGNPINQLAASLKKFEFIFAKLKPELNKKEQNESEDRDKGTEGRKRWGSIGAYR